MSRKSEKENKIVQAFLYYNKKLFDMAYLHLEKELSLNKLFNSNAKTQDLDFLINQRGKRNMIIGKRDTRFENRVMKTKKENEWMNV